MAGAIRRMATYLGLVEDDQFYADSAQPQPSRQSTATEPEGRVVVTERAPQRDRHDHGSDATVHDLARPWERAGYEIPIVLPTTYNDARKIGESFRAGSPVIMDLTSMTDADAKRIVDFAAGLVFGLRGMIERMSAKVFLLSPDGVDVSALAHEQLGESYPVR